MAIESTKRAVDRDESGRNVRAKRTAKPPAVIIVTNMEPMKLEICWTQRKIRDFRTAKLFQFLHHSERLPSINVSLVEEYIENYDPEDGSSVVQGRIIGIDETILEKVLFLPIGEMAVGTDESGDFSPGRYFKGGMSSFERSQGWRTQEAITPEYVEWLRFVLRRLGLYRHPTYVSKRLLYAAVGAFEGMVFNWAAYVATRIHAEIGAKFKLGKFTSLLCSNYVYAVIAHTLRQPPSEEENPIPVSAPLQRERNLLAQNHNVADVIHEIGESSRTVVQG